ncbi:hypothetical protein SAICODRAFT_89723 [Saitoella complicata NRRL Y-17804]|nr:uncharacterized protein SAICODRAFT_89723 [Saitoella complicata NRRL Y-17804]ODQ54776.1 hypothetical protein SAICODRAFT_89723 [Saitoella complicata NRRL Y-17804]
MSSSDPSKEELKARIAELERELEEFKSAAASSAPPAPAPTTTTTPNGSYEDSNDFKLSLPEYLRYGRQLLLPPLGLSGQLRLKQSSVLVIGAGGLGSPALMYLVGSGVGTVGVVDGDVVDVSNLHRQVMYGGCEGKAKVEGAREYLKRLNPNVNLVIYEEHLTPNNSLDTLAPYDLILDCTDTPLTRYLISDTCVLLNRKPLISASALKLEGTLTHFLKGKEGPCYRCIFPRAPVGVETCGDSGVLGPVVGVMGVLQALEAIKFLGLGEKDRKEQEQEGTKMLLFGAWPEMTWRSIKMRPRKKDCVVCGENPTITLEVFRKGEVDYGAFCGGVGLHDGERLRREERVKVQELKEALDKGRALVVDVRDETQYGITALPNSFNVPLRTLQQDPDDLPAVLQEAGQGQGQGQEGKEIFVVCRYGNDSQTATRILKEGWEREGQGFVVRDVIGGLDAWSREVDGEFPRY